MSEFERIVQVTPAFDKRSSDPSKDYGIGACRVIFILRGPKGATQFMIGTNWYLPHTQRENRKWQFDFDSKYDKINPQGWDVGYHSPVPMYEGQAPMHGECEHVSGGKCYYDGSGLRAEDWVPKFIAGGTDWLWKALEDDYRERFDTLAIPPSERGTEA